MLGTVPFTSVVANAEDTGVKRIELETGGVADKDFVYFGNYNNTDIKWKVLDADADNTGTANGMFLLSEYLLEQSNKPFDADSNVWQGSDAQAWCTAFAGSAAFTTAEKSALKGVTKTDAAIDLYYWNWGISELKEIEDKVFYLSAEEAAKYIGAQYGAPGLATTTSGGAAGGWWLRSPLDYFTDAAGYVDEDGGVRNYYVKLPYPGVRPAFNLNLGSVLFSSAAEGGKSSGTVGVAALSSVSEYTSDTADTAKEWKVTLLDTDRTFTAQAAEGATTTKDAGYSNWSVGITYSNAKTDTNEYVSAMLCDADDNVLYYGNIAQSSERGTQTVDIPKNLAAGTYTLKVFSEQLNGDINGDIKTDYASAFQTINLTVNAAPLSKPTAEFSATSENGGTLTNIESGMKYSLDGGNNWNTLSDTTATITGVTAENNIQVKRIGDGISTLDSEVQTIYVTQPSAPSGLSATACTSLEQNDGKISGVNNTMEFKLSSASEWQPVTGAELTGLSNGTYQVRVKADGTALASQASDVPVGEHTCVAQGDWQYDGENHWKVCTCGEKVGVTAHSGGTATCKDAAVCETCGHAYGSTNPANHDSLEKVEAKEATHLATGNIAYWHCTDCDKYYSDASAQTEISAADTVIAKLTGHTPDGTGWHSDENGHWNTCACGEKLSEEGHTFEWKIDKEAQVGTAGSKHEECTVCGYAKAAVEIPALAAPKIIEGMNGKWTQGSKEGLTFRSDAAFTELLSVSVDGKKLDDKDYTAKEGSTIVTLKAEYLDTLSVGEHTLSIQSTNGSAKTTFTIAGKATQQNNSDSKDQSAASPQTGDSSNMFFWLAVLIISTGGIATIWTTQKTRKKHSER